MARGTARAVGSPVTEMRLLPRALGRGLGEDDVLIDPPLTGGPFQDLLRGAGEIAADQWGEKSRLRAVALGEQSGPDALAGGLVEGLICWHGLLARIRPHLPGALSPRRQVRARRQSAEIKVRRGDGGGRGGRSAGGSSRPGLMLNGHGDESHGDQHGRADEPACSTAQRVSFHCGLRCGEAASSGPYGATPGRSGSARKSCSMTPA